MSYTVRGYRDHGGVLGMVVLVYLVEGSYRAHYPAPQVLEEIRKEQP
jgi:hypothetical protein